MLGTDSVKNYFQNNSAQTLPLVSAEWNYNLIYNTFATFSGANQTVAPTITDTAVWAKSGTNVSLIPGQDGYSSSAFTNLSSMGMYVSVTDANYTANRTNFEGSANFNVVTPSKIAGCYKIVFYARSTTSDIINLSTNVSNSAGTLNSTTSSTLDNFDWQKVTIVAGVKPTDPVYQDINLNFDFTNTTLSSIGTWGIQISQLRVYPITYFDYCYGNMWPTDSVFTYFRPGESYVTSGNSSIPEVTRTISGVPSQWNNAAPCSPIVYSPRTLFSANSNPAYKNGILSPLSKYKYFVSEVPSGSTSIGGVYDQLLSVNKIVLKFNISQSIPDNVLVSLYNPTSTTAISTVTIHSSDIKSSGICVLYWNGTNWTTSKWTWAPNATSQMPIINSVGQISKYQSINQIVLTQISSTVVLNYKTNSYNVSNSSSITSEFSRFQVIEISPRLELDLSSFVVEQDIQKSLDAKNTPLPISSMSANSATVHLSNIPIAGPNNAPYSIFSTNANDTYTTPLKNLIVKNVKFYINYYVPVSSVDSQANRIIPGGVFYTDTWDNTDLKVAKANCLDVIKFLQTISVNDYVAYEQNLVDIFSNLMDSSGFTDYNRDELASVLTDNNQYLTAGYFFADSANKTIYDVLHEAFMAYQIGSYVDEYGVLRFINLNSILTSNVSSLEIKDNSIVVDTYNENIKTKTGKVRMLYRSPQRKMSVTPITVQNDNTTILNQSPDIIWKQDTEDLVPFNYLLEPITTFSQNYYRVDPNSLNELFYTTTTDHDNYAIIEGEIISTGDKEWTLTDQNTNISRTVAISNQNDLANEVANFSNYYSSTSISKLPTGRFVNVKRGLFGTKASKHAPMTGNFSSRFQGYTQSDIGQTMNYAQSFTINGNGLIQVPVLSPYARAIAYPNFDLDQGYSTYSTKFRFPSKIVGTYMTAGIEIGTTTTLDNSKSLYASIEATSDKNTQYKLHYGTYNVADTIKDITAIINSDISNQSTTPIFATKEAGMIRLKLTSANILQPDGVTVLSQIAIYVNNHRILTGLPVSLLGQVGTKFGFYAHGDGTASSDVEFAELYACERSLDEQVNYHFQSFAYLDNLIADKRSVEKFYMAQSQPQIIGLNMYDVQLSATPSSGAEPLKIMYNLYYQDQSAAGSPTTYITVYENALSYSTIASTGFRAKFAVVNNSPYAVWTKTGTEYKQAVSAQFALFSRNMIVLTDQQTLERVLNPQNINEVVELQSDWVQSKKSADSILKVLANATDSFSKDITLSVFGNPLIQVGDIISLTYGIKNIKSLNFFVQGVTQTFINGLKTDLVLNQVSYTGNKMTSKKSSFPKAQAIANSSGQVSISPSYGSTTGGDTITVTVNSLPNSTPFTISNLPTVNFDNQSGYNVTYLNKNTVTVATPPHTASSVPVTVSFNGFTYNTAQYYAFTYKTVPPVVGAITDLAVYSDVYNPKSKNYDVALSWTQPLNSNAYDYSISMQSNVVSDNRHGINETYPFEGQAGLPYNISFDDVNTPTLGGGLKGGQVYTFTITPKNITGNTVNSTGQSMTISLKIGTDVTQSTVPVTVVSPVVGEIDVYGFEITGAGSYSVSLLDHTTQALVAGSPRNLEKATTNHFTNLNTSLTCDVQVYVYAGTHQTGQVLGIGRALGIKADGSNNPSTNTHGGPPAVPALSSGYGNVVPYTYNADGTVNFNLSIIPDTTTNPPTAYNITISPNKYGNSYVTYSAIAIASLSTDGSGNLLYTIPNSFPTGVLYQLTISATNNNGTSALSYPYTTGTVPAVSTAGNRVVTNLQASGNLNVTWTGDTSFTNYIITYNSGTNIVQYAINQRNGFAPLINGSYLSGLSSNGINFSDSQVAQNVFKAGDSVNITVQPYSIINGVSTAAQATSISYTIPPQTSSGGGGTTYNVPTPSFSLPIAQNFHEDVHGNTLHQSGGSWYWYDATPTPDYNSYSWAWEFYAGKTSASESPTSSGNLSNPNGGDGLYFIVQTSTTGKVYLRVRQVVIGKDNNTYYGSWYGQSATFT
jgi:hypothetical protein